VAAGQGTHLDDNPVAPGPVPITRAPVVGPPWGRTLRRLS